MDINSIKTGSPTALTQDVRGANSEMGKDEFLKLFVAQMQMQDPLNPTSNNEAMGQMAQFSTLEQISNLAKSNALSQSVGLIGRTVTWKDKTGALQSGVVEKVTQSNGNPVLTIGGTEGVDPNTITQIA